MLADFKYAPGTAKSTQQTSITTPAFGDTDHVHFPDGRLTNIPPYSVAAFSSDYVTINGSPRYIHAAKLTGARVGTYYFFATERGLHVGINGGLYNMTPLETTAVTLGADPITTTLDDATLIIAYTAHDLLVGDRIKIDGAADVGGIVAANDINKEHIVTNVINADSFEIIIANEATSDATGGGAAVEIYKQIPAGNSNQATATGYGTGLYGQGLYGQGGAAVIAEQFPRIPSLANFGNEILYCPGDYTAGDGQKIYIWDGNLEVAPTVLTNAPTDCNWVAVVNNAILALCGRGFQISEIGNGTVWSGLTTYSNTMQRVWKLIAAYPHGEKEAVIFTPNEAFLLRYVGSADLWDISDLFQDDGILSPMSACYTGTALEWRGYRDCYIYDGGSPKQLPNTQNGEWLAANINLAAAWKAFAMSDQQNQQSYYYFPTGADTEPNDYVIRNGESWTLGQMQRTAAQRPGFVDSAFYMAGQGDESTPATVYRHFTNGAVTFNWYAEGAYFYVDGGENRYLCDKFVPDANQSGDFTLKTYGKDFPNDADVLSNTETITQGTSYVSLSTAGALIKHRLEGSSAITLGACKSNFLLLGPNI